MSGCHNCLRTINRQETGSSYGDHRGVGSERDKAAEILGVRRATLSDLVNGNAALSPEMALRIEKAFSVGMDMLLRMQAWYDASQMRARASEISV